MWLYVSETLQREVEPVEQVIEGNEILDIYFTDFRTDQQRAEGFPGFSLHRLVTDPDGKPAISAAFAAAQGFTNYVTRSPAPTLDPANPHLWKKTYDYPDLTPEQEQEQANESAGNEADQAWEEFRANMLAARAEARSQIDPDKWQLAEELVSSDLDNRIIDEARAYLAAAAPIERHLDDLTNEYARRIAAGEEVSTLLVDMPFPTGLYAEVDVVTFSPMITPPPPSGITFNHDDSTRLNLPFGVRPLGNDDYVFSDFLNDKVKRYQTDGTISTEFVVTRPGGLEVLSSGDILVVSHNGEKLERWDGTTLTEVLTGRTIEGRGLVVDEANDRLYISNASTVGSTRVDVFRLSDMTLLRTLAAGPTSTIGGNNQYEMSLANGRCYLLLRRFGRILSVGPNDTAFTTHSTNVPVFPAGFGDYGFGILVEGDNVFIGQRGRVIYGKLDGSDNWPLSTTTFTNFVFGITRADANRIMITTTLNNQLALLNNDLTGYTVIGGDIGRADGDVDSTP